jgi:hypothetical protein
VRIDPSEWLEAEYARVREETDLIRLPERNYVAMSATEKDRLRQTQLECGEVVRVLGYSDAFALAMKFEGTLGWLPQSSIEYCAQKGFSPLDQERKEPADFFRSWKGTPYVLGGTSRRGIDCSGFAQRFFLEVHSVVIPKNSHDQRKTGFPKESAENGDLIFCHRIKGSGVHHVAVFFDCSVWHARLESGVSQQSWDEFLAVYDIEEIKSLTVPPQPGIPDQQR